MAMKTTLQLVSFHISTNKFHYLQYRKLSRGFLVTDAYKTNVNRSMQ